MRPFSRREFLVRGAIAGSCLGLAWTERALGARDLGIRRYSPLGSTGLEISDVSFGSSRLRGDASLVRRALDLGVNYFDTAEGYTGGRSEETIGRALGTDRNRVVLASKVVTQHDTSRSELERSLDGSLQRLRTDRIDVYFNHAVNDPRRLENPEWLEFVETAKRKGKIRFSGMSGHAGRLIECLDLAIDREIVDVVLVAYNFGQDPAFYQRFLKRFDMVALQPDLPRVLEKAKEKGIGVVAMKTLMGGRLNDLRAYETPGGTYAQAAFRWVLSSPHVDALIVSMTSRSQIDEYIRASGLSEVRASDVDLLRRYVERNGDSFCRLGCDACESSCPSGVPIAGALRSRMYAADYGDLDLARREYRLLDGDASACATCPGTPCATACAFGVPIDRQIAGLHERLVVPGPA